MTLKEAEKILELPENYTEQQVKEKYKTLMRRFHPDIKNEIPVEEKGVKSKEIIEAYKTITKHPQILLIQALDFKKTIKEQETYELQYKKISITNLPQHIQYTIEDTFQKFFQLSKAIQLKCYNIEGNIEKLKEEYNQKYYSMRKILTQELDLYLRENTPISSSFKNFTIKEDVYFRTNKGWMILDTLIEIVKKFLENHEILFQEKIRYELELKKEIMKYLNEETEKIKSRKINRSDKKNEIIKNTFQSAELEREMNKLVELTLEKVNQICAIPSNQIRGTFEWKYLLREFSNQLDNLVDSYTFYLENKATIVSGLNETIKNLSDETEKEQLLKEVSYLNSIQDYNLFESQMTKILEQLEENAMIEANPNLSLDLKK